MATPLPSLPVIAVIGATGNLGSCIINTLLLPRFLPLFKQVIVLSRSSSEATRAWASTGALIRTYAADSIVSCLQDVDVLVNTIGPAGHAFKDQLLHALPQTTIRLYVPSEFGVDHYLHDFDHHEWDAKKRHFQLTRELIPDIKVCRVFAGLFLEDSIGPWFGFNTKDSCYEAVGSIEQASTYTSLNDVGQVVALLAMMDPDAVPARVHLQGDSKSVQEIASIMQAARGSPIRVSSIDLGSYRDAVIANPSDTPERYLRFLMGDGRLDHSKGAIGNDNALFEAYPQFDRWRTIKNLAQDTKGAPWANATWELDT